MSPIEVRHRVRAQPIDLESGIVFRNGRADFVEDVHKVLSRIADRTESALRHARYACSTRAIELRDRFSVSFENYVRNVRQVHPTHFIAVMKKLGLIDILKRRYLRRVFRNGNGNWSGNRSRNRTEALSRSLKQPDGSEAGTEEHEKFW